jgi:phospholipid transport system substrate-binding protein
MIRTVISTLLLSLALLSNGRANAQSPTQVLRNAQTKINKLLSKKTKEGSVEGKKNKEEVKKIVNTLLDYQELAKLSLGKHWKDRTEKEQIDFTGILRDLIESNYIKQIRSNLGYTLEYRKEKNEGETAQVETVIKVKKNNRLTEIIIEYLLRKTKGSWMVYDLVTDGVSLVKNYRSQFNRIIRKESYEALVKKMKGKIEEKS